jgi:hypothetical protein
VVGEGEGGEGMMVNTFGVLSDIGKVGGGVMMGVGGIQ